jgi:hypothetical protein
MPFVVESPFCDKAVPLVVKEQYAFPHQFETNFERFSISLCVSHDSMLNDYFLINMKVYHPFLIALYISVKYKQPVPTTEGLITVNILNFPV